MKRIGIGIGVVLSMLLASHRAEAQARTFTFVNQCSETVWVGSLGNPGHFNPNGGGWAVGAGSSSSLTIPSGWAGRFWGRRGCNFDGNGNGTCATGDCGGRLQCSGAGGVPPTSLAEFTLNGGGNVDYYDVSLVDGYDLPVAIGTDNPSCGGPTCVADLLNTCPSELQKRDGAGRVVACLSACARFNSDQYCCRGAYGTPQTCNPNNWPVNYAAIFKRACPNEYSYAYDDTSSTFTCGSPNPNYRITFCPNGGGNQTSGWVQLINQTSTKCVDDTEWRTGEGTPVQQYGCGDHQANQQWQLVPTDSGYYRIVNRNSNLVLDVAGGPGATARGVKVQLWSSWSGANQQWKAVAMGNGYYQLVARHSGKCLDVPSSSIDNGVVLQQWDCNGTGAQSFRMVPQ
ncbi:MAG: pathosis-related protein 5-like [Myxococcales bacterium]|nr:pathosis-related protein 5-like [Myxococcales bacterium]